MHERGYKPEQVEEALKKRESDAIKYVHPQKQFADLIIQYLPTHLVSLDIPPDQLQLRLKVILDANISLDQLLHFLRINNYQVEWDYENNLEKQYLLLMQPIPRELLQAAAHQLLPSMEDFIPRNAQWAENYRGAVQLLILLMVQAKMVENSHARI